VASGKSLARLAGAEYAQDKDIASRGAPPSIGLNDIHHAMPCDGQLANAGVIAEGKQAGGPS
jgi:hypothetical protein